MLPGSSGMVPKFDLTYVDMKLMKPNAIGDKLVVTPYPAYHTAATNPTSIRCEAGGKVVSYTGDSQWTKHMPKVANNADLFICECYFYAKPVRFHMNYPDIKEHWDEFGHKRIILTHFSREMLPMADKVPEECAHDGLVVNI
jgi:ribonuclease BN (tRNA processing enzyme)